MGLVEDKLHISQECALAVEAAANSMLGYCNRIWRVGKRGMGMSLYSAIARLPPEYCVQFWIPKYRKDIARCLIESLEEG